MEQLLRSILIEPLLQENYALRLVRALEAFSGLLLENGESVAPYTENALARFASYPVETQSRIYHGFLKYVSAVLEIVEAGIPLRNTEQSLWCLFKKHGLRPRHDLFSSIDKEDMIEIYLPNQLQWYRSFNYFQYSSYSLGELICIPWQELYAHQDTHMSFFQEITEGIFSNRIQESVFPGLGPSTSKELFSSKQLLASLEARILSPVSGIDGRNEAFVVSWKVQLLDSLSINRGPEVEFKGFTSPQLVANVLDDGIYETPNAP